MLSASASWSALPSSFNSGIPVSSVGSLEKSMQDNQVKPITGRGRGSTKAFHLSQQPQTFCLNLFSPAKNQGLPVKMPLPASHKQVDNYSSNKILKFYSQKVAKRSKGIQERCSKTLSEWYVLNWSEDLRKLYFYIA